MAPGADGALVLGMGATVAAILACICVALHLRAWHVPNVGLRAWQVLACKCCCRRHRDALLPSSAPTYQQAAPTLQLSNCASTPGARRLCLT